MLTVDSPVEIHDGRLIWPAWVRTTAARFPACTEPRLFQFSAGHSNLTYS